MMDYEKLFSETLYTKLKEKVIAKVFVNVNVQDQLYVHITRHDGIDYELYIDNFSDKFINGWTTDYAAYEVLEDYKKYIKKIIFNKYFV